MKAFITVVVVAGILGGLGFVGLKADADHAAAPPAKAPNSGPEQVAANGVVEGARPEVALRPEIAGALAAVHVRENQDVAKGALLAELHNETQKEQVAIAKAEAQLAKAQLERLVNGEQVEKRRSIAAVVEARRAVYQQAQAEYERSQRLTHASSREQQEQVQTRMLRAQAELAQSEAEQALIEAPARTDEVAAARVRVAAADGRLRLAEAELAKTRLLAPTAGRILQVYAEPGELAGPTSAQPILILADLSKLRVRAFVEELDAARVKVGQTAVVTADGLPGQEFQGQVAVVLPRMGKRALQSDAPGEYKDLYYREVLIDLDRGAELPVNLRVETRLAAPQGVQ